MCGFFVQATINKLAAETPAEQFYRGVSCIRIIVFVVLTVFGVGTCNDYFILRGLSGFLQFTTHGMYLF